MKLKLFFAFFALFAGLCSAAETTRADFQKQYRRLWNEKLTVDELAQIENAIMQQADLTSPIDFERYVNQNISPGQVAEIRRKYPIIDFLEDAFDRILDGVKNSPVEPGKVHIYYLYNMGYVIKTPTLVIGLDICHRRGEALAPYLDLAVVTHAHQDHYTVRFLAAMKSLGKPIFSNFYSVAPSGFSKELYREVVMPTLTIRTYASDHFKNSHFNFVMPVELEIKTGDAECVIFSSGDTCTSTQLRSAKAPDIFIVHPRMGSLADTAQSALLLGAKCTFISHLLELRHGKNFVCTIPFGYSELNLLRTNNLVGAIPLWGEKFVWPLTIDEANNYNLHLPAPAAQKPLRIMPVGDDITRGSYFEKLKHASALPSGGGYRKVLQEKLRAAGYTYQFVGELLYWAHGNARGVCDPDFQRCHHGLASFSNRMIREGGVLPPEENALLWRDQKCKQISVPGIEETLRRWKPDVVLLMSGSNGFDAAERDKLIDAIARNFSGTLLVGTIPPQKAPREDFERVDEYNSSLATYLAAPHENWKSRVFLVDINSQLTTDDLLPDGIHPTQAGLEKIAAAFFAAIQLHCPQN